MDCLNAGLAGPRGSARKGKGSSRKASPAAAAQSKENSPLPVALAAEPSAAAGHALTDDTPPIMNMKKIPNTPMLSTGGHLQNAKARPVLATVDGNTPAATPAAAKSAASAKPPRGGAAGPRPASQQPEATPAAAGNAPEPQPAASTSGASADAENLSVSRAAEAKMDDAMANARRMMEAARAKKQAARRGSRPLFSS